MNIEEKQRYAEKVFEWLCEFDIRFASDIYYAKWAVGEVIIEIARHPWRKVIDIVEEYADTWRIYSENNALTKRGFSVSADLMDHYSDLYHAGLLKKL